MLSSTYPTSSQQYTPIPENEDSTPESTGLLSSISRRAKKSLNVLAICVSVFVIVAGIFIFAIKIKNGPDNTVTVIQTSTRYGHKLSNVNLNELHSMGFQPGKLAFGNAECTIADANERKCIPPIRRTSKIVIDSTQQYQKMIGFGGAFTEASAINYFKLPLKIRQKFMDLYFDAENGIGYNLGRIHINSCDFSPISYSFDEVPNDYDLLYFDSEVTHDTVEIIPFILTAMSISKTPIKLLASPWSPPSWMKLSTTKDGQSTMTSSATPNGLIDTEEVKTTWANYISKFISAYVYKGVKIWAVTPQNEPEFPAPWEACAYTAENEKDFVTGYLGPALRSNHPDVLILGFDHNKDHLRLWSDELLTGHGHKYFDGMAFHWYAANDDRYLDGTFGYDNVNYTHFIAPDKILLASEGCSCPGILLNSQVRAERLIHDIIYNTNNWAQGWIDWNLLLDEVGGPNHLQNYCDAPIITNANYTDIIVQPKYYYFGHVSKYVPPDSYRIGSSVVGSYGYTAINPNVRPGFELGVFPCEQSVRQIWFLRDDGLIELSTISQDEETNPVYSFEPLCIGGGYDNRPYLNVVFCSGNTTGTSIPHEPLKFIIIKGGQIKETKTGLCVGLANDVAESGALLELQPCYNKTKDTPVLPDTQRFFYESVTGEITSYVPSNIKQSERDITAKLCLTAGWPFLSTMAFKTPTDETVVVIMNEANIDTQIILTDVKRTLSEGLGHGDLWFGIPGRSIQTIIYK